jgi:chemotaxis protein MotA
VKKTSRMDLASIIGLVVAFAAILGGQVLEGGHIASILQPTAAVIVLGGTLGAVAVQFSSKALKQALRDVKLIFRPVPVDHGAAVEQIVALASKARREGLISIEKDASALEDPFMRRAFEMAIDGTESKALRNALEMEITHAETEGEVSAKVFEAAGGYAPTVGIIGAVLGLIHVMENLADPSKLGSGIAVAFVATVYGVVTANLVLLPMAGKLKLRHQESIVSMEVVLEGVCAITDGEHPQLIERKLSIYNSARHEGSSRGEAIASAQLRAA